MIKGIPKRSTGQNYENSEELVIPIIENRQTENMLSGQLTEVLYSLEIPHQEPIKDDTYAVR